MENCTGVKKKNVLVTFSDLDESLENYIDWEKFISKGEILYSLIYITFLK